MLIVKRSSLFFAKGLKFFFFLVSFKYLAIFNFFNVFFFFFFKIFFFFFFSSSFVGFFFRDIFFFKFLNPFCLLVFPVDLDSFLNFFKEFSSELFLVGFSFDFFFINSRFFFSLDFVGVSFYFIYFFFLCCFLNIFFLSYCYFDFRWLSNGFFGGGALISLKNIKCFL